MHLPAIHLEVSDTYDKIYILYNLDYYWTAIWISWTYVQRGKMGLPWWNDSRVWLWTFVNTQTMLHLLPPCVSKHAIKMNALPLTMPLKRQSFGKSIFKIQSCQQHEEEVVSVYIVLYVFIKVIISSRRVLTWKLTKEIMLEIKVQATLGSGLY